MNVIVADQYKEMTDETLISDILHLAMQKLGRSNTICEVVIEGDQFVRNLNNRYRGINRTTDVLSFEANVVDPATNQIVLGELIISAPQVKKHAEERGIRFEDELAVVLIHGLLHLHGMDHADETGKKTMWAVQGDILKSIGVDVGAHPR